MALSTDKGIIGYGAQLDVSSDAGVTWTNLGGVADITPPNAAVDQIEITTMSSPGRVKEYIAGLTDLGDMTVTMNYVPGSATDEYCVAWRTAGDTRQVRITYPITDKTVTDTFAAFVLAYAPTLATAAKASASLKMKVAGAVTRVG